MKKNFLLFWKNPCQLIYMVMMLLLLIGGTNIFSASYVEVQYHYLVRYFFFAIIGFLCMAFVRRVGYKIFFNTGLIWSSYIIVLGMLILVELISDPVKGAARWLYLGPISIQPSEFAKLVIIMLSAKYFGNMLRQGKRISFLSSGEHWHVLAATAVYAALVYLQPDLGTAAIIFALMLGMYIIAGVPMGQIIITVGSAGVMGVIATLSSAYRLDRVKVWFDPWLDPRGKGYQMVQSLLAIGSGGLTGTHWGHGASKFFYLPERHTDFAFALFCQENGFIGAMFLMVLFALLAYAFCTITVNARDKRGFLLAGGVTFLIIGQAIANMAMVCGILPVIGVPLIFISYGGSSMFLSMIAIGLLLSVYDEEVKQAEQDALPPQERRSDLRMMRNERWRS